MIKTKIFNKKTGIAYLEIFLLITMIFSFSYLVYESSNSLHETISQIKNVNPIKPKNNFLKILGGIILKKFKEPFLPMVSAAAGDVCCERTNTGVWCEETSSSNCDGNYDSGPISCEDTDWCSEGCCYNPSEGTCTDGTYEGSCDGGNWKKGLCSSNLDDCREACCIYGGESTWTTETECEVIAANYLDRAWDTTIGSDVECTLLSQNQGVGACIQDIDEERNCRFVPEAECLGNDVLFYENHLCTHPVVNSSCEMTQETTCVTGKDEVYFLDSCGNTANIYDSSKIDNATYWETKVAKRDSCNFGDLTGNANSPDCGNCKYIDGSKCDIQSGINPTYGENICIDLSCDVEIDGNAVTKQNGESWCAFDGAVGVGESNGNKIARDVVGSRHWRHVCLDGEERVEPCAEYRNEVCSESIEPSIEPSNGRTYSQCRINRWRDCINRELDICEENSDCWKKHIGVDDFVFDVCLPKYPGGFDIFNTDVSRNGGEICEVGTQTCHVVYVKEGLASSCECVTNCECEEPGFTEEMNSFCTSLGDCGGYVNTEGKYSDQGYKVSGAPKISNNIINEYIKFANMLLWPNQIIDPGAFVASPSYLSGIGPIVESPEEPGWNLNAASAAAGAVSVGALGYGIYTVIAFCPACVVNPILLGAIVLLLILTYFLGKAEICKEIDVTYTCKSWQPPVGGDDCEKCNGDDQKPCTPYRCKTLGKACEFINEGTGNELCIASVNDGLAPRISPSYTNLTEGLVYENIQTNGFEIKNTNRVDGCLESAKQATFGIKTDERATCKYDLSRGTIFNEKLDYFGGVNYLIEDHVNNMALPSPELLAHTYNIPNDFILETYGNLEMFIECQDNWGHGNSINEYVISFCVKQGADHTPPYITPFTEPASGSYIAYGDTDQDVKFWVDESAECRYTESSSTIDYANMENNISCKALWTDYEFPRGYPCEFSLTNFTQDKSVWIRCKDKPWLPDSNSSRNVNRQSVEYVTKVSDSELEIEEMRPDQGDVVISGVNPTSLNLKIKTSGGAEEGKAICKWAEDDYGWRSDFVDTNSIYHESPEFTLYEGTYNFDYFCEDVAGNTAERSSSFEIEFDETGPRIVRIYFESGLKITTKESAECRYSFQRSTTWSNSTVMSGDSLEHVADWELKTYYVQCEDEFNNKGGKKRIKAYNLL
jgi:hypothetical protein